MASFCPASSSLLPCLALLMNAASYLPVSTHFFSPFNASHPQVTNTILSIHSINHRAPIAPLPSTVTHSQKRASHHSHSLQHQP